MPRSITARRMVAIALSSNFPSVDSAGISPARAKRDGEVIFQLNTLPNPPPVTAILGGGGPSAREALRTSDVKANAFLEKTLRQG